MSPTRARAKGRRGGEVEPFAMIPLGVMESHAVKTLPHAAFKILVILVAGQVRARNGTLACSDTYARRFGIRSSDTVHRSLKELRERGLIVVTRRGMRMRKWLTLYAVTWLPIVNRDGKPLDTPEPATHEYNKWPPPSQPQ